MIARDALLLLLLSALLAGLAAVHPLAALVGLGGGALLLPLFTGTWTYPGFLLAFCLALYVITGAPNISLYRGEIDPGFLQFMTFSCLSLVTGFAVGSLWLPSSTVRDARRDRRHTAPALPLPAYTPPVPFTSALLWVSAAPGILGLAWMLAQSGGIPLFKPSLRFAVDPRALVLVEMLLVPLILRGVNLMHTHGVHRHTFLPKAELALWFCLLSLAGYRGWVVEGLAVLSLTALSHGGVTRRKLVWALIALGASLAVLVTFVLIRRLTQAELFDPAESLRLHGAENLPGWFAQLHFSVRESLYTAQGLWSMRMDGLSGPSLLFADILTLLPGKQQAAGGILGDFFGRSLAGGLTASLPGVLYYEMGSGAYPALAALGTLMGAGWRWVGPRPRFATLSAYFLLYVFVLHLFHRGTVKVAYIAVPFFLCVVLTLAAPRRKRHPDSPTPGEC